MRRKERRRSIGFGKEWMIIYSDLMTNLMLFFLMLFALTRLTLQDQDKVHQSMRKDFTTIQEKVRFQEVIRIEKGTEDEISVLMSQYGMSINVSERFINIQLPNPILFEVGKAELKEEGKNILEQISQIIVDGHQQIIIKGHTDNQPLGAGAEFFSNWELSAARAVSAVNYLVLKGIDSERLSAIAQGEHHPVAPNDSEENMERNRRIEISIVKEG